MLQDVLRFNKTPWIDSAIKWLIALVLQILVGPVVLSLKGEMPITLQSLVILFGAIAFGWRIGAAAALAYIVAGALGVPVFAGYLSGLEKVMGQHGGFFFHCLNTRLRLPRRNAHVQQASTFYSELGTRTLNYTSYGRTLAISA
jgi:hypothetical protein